MSSSKAQLAANALALGGLGLQLWIASILFEVWPGRLVFLITRGTAMFLVAVSITNAWWVRRERGPIFVCVLGNLLLLLGVAFMLGLQSAA